MPKVARYGDANLTERRDRTPLPAAVVRPDEHFGQYSVSPLGINNTGNNKSRHKHDENNRCDTHHDVCENEKMTHYNGVIVYALGR